MWQARFYGILQDFRFLPGGRIQAGAGTAHKVTLFNCFVMGAVTDSMDGIFDALKEGAVTMQQGVGVGSVASGPVSFMRIWDSMCALPSSPPGRGVAP